MDSLICFLEIVSLLFLITSLLRYYSHTIKFTIFKGCGSVGFSILAKLCNHNHYLVPEHFHHPE